MILSLQNFKSSKRLLAIVVFLISPILLVLSPSICFGAETKISAPNQIKNGSFEKGLKGWDYGTIKKAYQDVFDNRLLEMIKVPGAANYFFINLKYLKKEIIVDLVTLDWKKPQINIKTEFRFFNSSNVVIAKLTFNLMSSSSGDSGKKKSSFALNKNGVPDIHIFEYGFKKGGRKTQKFNNILKIINNEISKIKRKILKESEITKIAVYLQHLPKGTNTIFFGWRKYALFKDVIFKEIPSPKPDIAKLQTFSKKDSPSVIKAIHFLPSDGKSYLELNSSAEETSLATQRVQVDPESAYIFSVDSKVLTGRMKPYVHITDSVSKKILFSDTIDVDLAQGGWVRIGGIIKSIGREIAISMFSFSNNVHGKYGVSIAYDNIQLYKIPLSENFSFIQEIIKKLDVKKDGFNYFNLRKIPYQTLYTSKIKEELQKEYENLGVPVYELNFDETKYWSRVPRFYGIKAEIIASGNENMFPATLKHKNKTYEVKIRIRGDSVTHTYSPTKSWRINFTNPKYFNKARSINLIRPEARGIVGEHNNYFMAKKMGLVYLDNRFVFLKINQKPYGLMFEIEHWKNIILEKNKLPEGNIYAEDNRPKDKSRAEQALVIFKKYPIRDLNEWKKHAKDPFNYKKAKHDLKLLHEFMNYDFYPEFENLLNTKKWITWNVHSILIGSDHQDSFHNNKLYFNNTDGRFEMIPWDTHMRFVVDPKDPQYEPFFNDTLLKRKNFYMDYLLKDSNIFEKRNQILWNYLQNKEHEATDTNFIKTAYQKIKNELSMTPRYDFNWGKSIIPFAKIDQRMILVPAEYRNYRQSIKNYLKKNARAIDSSIAEVNIESNLKIVKLKVSRDDENNELSSTKIRVQLKKPGVEKKTIKVFVDDGDGIFNKKMDEEIPIYRGKDSMVFFESIIPSKFHHSTYIFHEPYVIHKKIFNYLINSKQLSILDKNLIREIYSIDPLHDNQYYEKRYPDTPKKTIRLRDIFLKLSQFQKYNHERNFFIVIENPTDLSEIKNSIAINAFNSTTGVPVQVSKPAIEDETILISEPVQTKNTIENNKLQNIKAEIKREIYKFTPTHKKEKFSFSFYDQLFENEDSFSKRYPFFVKIKNQQNSYKLPRGTYVIKKTIVIPKRYEIVIEPGAKLLFEKGISFISLGKVKALGTASQKIIFTSSNFANPWGVLGLIREDADSEFKYCIFENGGNDYINGIYFSGMLSVHYSNVKIENSIFRYASRKKGDDALNVKNGLVTIHNSRFEKNFKDAIDFDFVKKGSIIEKSQFYKNGNDSIDISGSKNIKISQNIIVDSGDKGISIGEDSSLSITDNTITGGLYGIAAKDSSSVKVIKSKILNNNVGIAVFNKKMIFDGAKVLLESTVVENNIWNFGVEEIKKNDKNRFEVERFKSKIISKKTDYDTTNDNYKLVVAQPKKSTKSKKSLLKAYLSGKLASYKFKFVEFKDHYNN